MDILRKRAIAAAIDSLMYGSVVATLSILFSDIWMFLLDTSSLIVALFFLPLFMRDMLFGNASMGKKIMGIEIYDLDWQKPALKKLVVRSFFTNTIGISYFWKAKFNDGNMLSVIDFEREKCQTRVVDKKVLKKLQEEAKSLKGDFNKNLSQLYDEYLRNCYL